MKATRRWAPIFLLGICTSLLGQIKHTSIPLGDAINSALSKSSLAGENAQPFHIRLVVSEPENPKSPYQGSIEEWWVGPDQWRREVKDKDGLHQTIVVAAGKKTEKDEGAYFPLWLRNFVTAIFDSIPNASAWKASGAMIDQITLPNGSKSDACVRAQSKIGSGDTATDAFTVLCFDGEGRVKSFVSPRYSMEFHDYSKFGQQQIARKYIDDPEPGTTLVGQVQVLEDESRSASPDLFSPLGSNDDQFQTAAVSSKQLESLAAGNPAISWPSVRSGNAHGHLAMYISVDNQGQVREAWPLNSDNAGLEDPARDQVREWKLKPAVDASGKPVQVDGGLGFLFDTKIDDPLPVISGDQIASQMSGCKYNPTLKPGLLPSGKTFNIRVSVNEEGKNTGESFPQDIPWDVIQKTGFSTYNCRFKPYLVDGNPTYYYIDFLFTAP